MVPQFAGTDVAVCSDMVMTKYAVLVAFLAVPALAAISNVGSSASKVVAGTTRAHADGAQTVGIGSRTSAGIISNAARTARKVASVAGDGAREVPAYFRARLDPGVPVARSERADVWSTHRLLDAREQGSVGAGRVNVSAHRTGYLDGDKVEHAFEGHAQNAAAWQDPDKVGKRFVGEIDVYATADQPAQGVVTHDPDTIRATGIPGSVESRTLDELRALRLLDRNGNASEHTMVSLDDVNQLPLSPISVEAKTAAGAAVIVRKLNELPEAQRAAYLQHAGLYSQSPEAMGIFREGLGRRAALGLDKKDTTQWLLRTLPGVRHFFVGPGPKPAADANWISRGVYALKTAPILRSVFRDRMPNRFGADFTAPPLNIAQVGKAHALAEKYPRLGQVLRRVPVLSKRHVKAANEHGLQVWTWTLNTEPEVRKALKLGVDFYTDSPALVLRVVEKMKAEGHRFP